LCLIFFFFIFFKMENNFYEINDYIFNVF